MTETPRYSSLGAFLTFGWVASSNIFGCFQRAEHSLIANSGVPPYIESLRYAALQHESFNGIGSVRPFAAPSTSGRSTASRMKSAGAEWFHVKMSGALPPCQERGGISASRKWPVNAACRSIGDRPEPGSCSLACGLREVGSVARGARRPLSASKASCLVNVLACLTSALWPHNPTKYGTVKSMPPL